MATNPAIERAQLFAFLQAENPTTLPVFNETIGELQLVVVGPNAGDRRTVQLKAKTAAELLNYAPIAWWQQPASKNELVNAINNSWISVPAAAVSPGPAPIPPAPDEDDHFIVLWNATSRPQLAASGKARMHFDGAKVLLSENGADYASILPPVTVTTLTYAASMTLDFDPALAVYRTVALTGNVTFTSSNLGAGRQVSLRIVSDGSIRTFTFPAGWKFIGAVTPADIAASKTGILSLVSYGASDADVVAAYSVEP